MKNIFTRVSAAAVVAGNLLATEASAQDRNVVEGSVQKNGDVCFNMPKIRLDGQGVVQPNGTSRVCTDAAGTLKTEKPKGALFDANTLCVVKTSPTTIKPVLCP